MPGYILVDVKTRKTVAICMCIAVLLFILGIVIGYVSHTASSSNNADVTPRRNAADDTSVSDVIQASCGITEKNRSAEWDIYMKRFTERHNKRICVTTPKECKDFGLPRRYIAYHLNGKFIKIDGQLNDEAWNEVPWTENFVDIRGAMFPVPYYDSKVKVRWDDNRMYIAGYMQEEHIWATMDTQDDKLFLENAFDMFIDVDGTMFNYKQIQINALGTMMDQMLYMSPHDTSEDAKLKIWHPIAMKGVSINGTLNFPHDIDKSWSFEMSFSFAALAASSDRANPKVTDNEVWFMQFARAQQTLNTKNGYYQKEPRAKTTWWSWQPCDAINLHLQDRWGLVQFKRDMNDKRFSFPKWHIYKALFDMLNAMKKYRGVNAKYTDTIVELDLPPYLLSGACVDVPKITLNKTSQGFEVMVKSRLSDLPPAYINNYKYVHFD